MQVITKSIACTTDAEGFEWESAVVREDTRKQYSEPRWYLLHRQTASITMTTSPVKPYPQRRSSTALQLDLQLSDATLFGQTPLLRQNQ